MNQDEHKWIGTRWIALYVDRNNASYLNSFRIECNSIEIERFISNKNIITNISRLQAYDSVTSGYFCTEFIDFMFCTEFIDFMLKSKMSIDYITSRAPWCSGYCTTSFNKILTQILHRFKPCLLRVRDLCWWESLAMVPAGNRA